MHKIKYTWKCYYFKMHKNKSAQIFPLFAQTKCTKICLHENFYKVSLYLCHKPIAGVFSHFSRLQRWLIVKFYLYTTYLRAGAQNCHHFLSKNRFLLLNFSTYVEISFFLCHKPLAIFDACRVKRNILHTN